MVRFRTQNRNNQRKFAVFTRQAYIPNCDSLAALLGSSIDSHASTFAGGYQQVKHEPFDQYTDQFLPQPPVSCAR